MLEYWGTGVQVVITVSESFSFLFCSRKKNHICEIGLKKKNIYIFMFIILGGIRVLVLGTTSPTRAGSSWD